VDGIVLHQILQWHHMLTGRAGFAPTSVDNLKENTVADGLFHAFTWLAVACGIWLLWRRDKGSWRWAESGHALTGWIIVGWGAFNLVEGIVDHEILGIHHVRDDVANHLPWDLGFLGFGALLVLLGLALARASPTRVGAARGTRARAR